MPRNDGSDRRNASRVVVPEVIVGHELSYESVSAERSRKWHSKTKPRPVDISRLLCGAKE
jgi:hypothetical protein